MVQLQRILIQSATDTTGLDVKPRRDIQQHTNLLCYQLNILTIHKKNKKLLQC